MSATLPAKCSNAITSWMEEREVGVDGCTIEAVLIAVDAKKCNSIPGYC